jgi:hypothetical protein
MVKVKKKMVLMIKMYSASIGNERKTCCASSSISNVDNGGGGGQGRRGAAAERQRISRRGRKEKE